MDALRREIIQARERGWGHTLFVQSLMELI
jgi:hypothetical protein